MEKRLNFLIKMVTLVTILNIFSCVPQNSGNQKREAKFPNEVRFIRAYGDNDETKPPVLLLKNDKKRYYQGVSADKITIELDIKAPVSPALYVKFVHCDVNWNETENVFLSGGVNLRTSNITWSSSTFLDDYYSHRAKVQIPTFNVEFRYGGNYKAKFYDYDDDSKPIAETKFFVVDPKAESRMILSTDFYKTDFNISKTAYNIHTTVVSSENLFETQLQTNVVYRNNRWFEPFVVSQNPQIQTFSNLYRYNFQTTISGFSAIEKIFRIYGIPSDNAYRILQMTNLAEFPRSSGVVRLPFSDLRRNGTFWERDDDGALVTNYISSYNDDYVLVEFLLDAQGYISLDDVFITGSFNNWHPDKTWQMHYDANDRYYKLHQWVRRGRHNYLYGTGRLNIDNGYYEKFSCDEYEGTTANSSHTFLSFIYYREIDLGGYDNIISVGAANIFGNVKK